MNEAQLPPQGFILDIAQSIGRLDGKVDQLIAMQTNAKETTDDHEARLRALEKHGWKQHGIVVGVSGLVSIVIALSNKIGIIP